MPPRHLFSLLALCVAAPAAAATDFLLTLDGVPGESGEFSYSSERLGTLTPLTDTTGCDGFITGSRCVTFGGALPGAFLPPGGASQVIVQPGAGLGIVVSFTAPMSGIFDIEYVAELLDDRSNGVGVHEAFGFGTPPLEPVGLLLPAVQKVREAASRLRLERGDSFFLGFNDNDDPAFDRIGLQIAVTRVPEPATWALLIAGFGMTGTAIRRRHRTPASG